MIKRKNKLGNTFFTRKNKRCSVALLVSNIRPSLSRDHQTAAIMNLNIQYCFLNDTAEDGNTSGTFCHPVLMDTCPTCSHLS